MRCPARGTEHEVKPEDEEGPVRIRATANFTASSYVVGAEAAGSIARDVTQAGSIIEQVERCEKRSEALRRALWCNS